MFITKVSEMPVLIFTVQAVFLSSLQFLIFSVRVLNASTGAVWIKSCSLGRLSFISDLKLKEKLKEKQKEEVSTRLIQEEFIHLTGEKNKSSEKAKL